MADRTHFYPEHKECDLKCQWYDKESDALFFCQHFEITDMLPIGDGHIIPHVNGYCMNNYYYKDSILNDKGENT